MKTDGDQDESYVICETSPLDNSHGKAINRKSISNPVNLAVSGDGQYFAVTHQSKEVLVYRRGLHEAIAGMKPVKSSSNPSDICFYFMDGREVLLVADSEQNQIYVMDFLSKVHQILGSLAFDCNRLASPTAMATDTTGRLWIGCKDGKILTCVPTEIMLPDEEQLTQLYEV